MKLKTILVVAIFSIGMLSSCGEKKNKETDGSSSTEEVVKEIETEVSEESAKIEAAKKREADSLRKVDSLQQVKEHGHVH